MSAPAANPPRPAPPTPAECAAILRAAGIADPLTRLDIFPAPDYAANVTCLLNDAWVLRVSTASAAPRFARERRALAILRHLPAVPRVLAHGTLPGGARYLLQTRLLGEPVIAQWPDTPEPVRRGLIAELIGIVRAVHRLPARTYAIGHYGSAAPALRHWRGTWLAGHDRSITALLAAIRRWDLTPAQSALVADAEAFYGAHRTALGHAVGPRMAHGDLHLHNVLVRDGHVTGVIDWEWSLAGGVEPDFDLEALVRWAIFPRDLGDEAEAARLDPADFAGVIPALLEVYPEVAAVPRLAERMTIYQVEHELHQMVSWPPRVPTRPTERLAAWLHDPTLMDNLR